MVRVLAGHRAGEVAEQLGVSRQTVYKWVRRHPAKGEAGPVDIAVERMTGIEPAQ